MNYSIDGYCKLSDESPELFKQVWFIKGTLRCQGFFYYSDSLSEEYIPNQGHYLRFAIDGDLPGILIEDKDLVYWKATV